MGDRPDPLRGTLDHLKLDPKARNDREYLESVLRRLGFDIEEMQAGEGRRVVEVEFDPAKRSPGTTFEILAGPEAAEMQEFILVNEDDEVFEFKLVEDDEDEGPILDTGDWDEPDWPEESDRDEAAPVPAGSSDDDWAPAGEDEAGSWPDARDGESDEVASTTELQWPEETAQPETVPEENEDADPGQEEVVPWPGEEMEQQSPPATEPETAWPDEATTEPQTADVEETEPVPWPTQEKPAEPEQEQLPEAAPETGEPYRHGDYTLCTRQIELTAGSHERIYFFAKQVPNGWDPSPIPEGFEVKINDRNGLPYLERSAGA